MIYPGSLCISRRCIVLLKNKRMVNQYFGVISAKSPFFIVSIEELTFDRYSLYVITSSMQKMGWIYDLSSSFDLVV